jgi:hypothetical protein
MKFLVAIFIILIIEFNPCFGSYPKRMLPEIENVPFEIDPAELFRQRIPDMAKAFIGMPYKYGGKPEIEGLTDNSALFYSIYTLAAKAAGLRYRSYLPMRYLLKNCHLVESSALKNGDLMVLNNNLAAMIYKVESSNKLYLIYASEKRKEVIVFHSQNPVFTSYWMEHLKGFYRLNKDMLIRYR